MFGEGCFEGPHAPSNAIGYDFPSWKDEGFPKGWLRRKNICRSNGSPDLFMKPSLGSRDMQMARLVEQIARDSKWSECLGELAINAAVSKYHLD